MYILHPDISTVIVSTFPEFQILWRMQVRRGRETEIEEGEDNRGYVSYELEELVIE